jgi:hypothetical protein
MDVFAKENTENNMETLISELKQNDTVVFKEPGQKTVINDCIHALRQSCKRSLGDSPTTLDEGARNLLKDKFLVGKSLVRKWDNETEFYGFEGWCSVGLDYMSICDASIDFSKLAKTRQARFESPEGHDCYSKLKAAVQEVDVQVLMNKYGPEALESEEWLSLRKAMQPIEQGARTFLDEYTKDALDDAIYQMREGTKELALIQGGIPDGASWKDGLLGTSSLDDVSARAEATVLGKPGRGLPKKLKEKRAILKKIIAESISSALKVVDELPESVSLEIHKSKLVLSASDITILEATILQKMLRDSSPMGERSAFVQAELDRVQDAPDLDTSMIQKTLYSEALQFVQST